MLSIEASALAGVSGQILRLVVAITTFPNPNDLPVPGSTRGAWRTPVRRALRHFGRARASALAARLGAPMLRLWLLFTLLFALPASAAWEPEGVDLTRPRLLFRAEDLAGIQAKIARDPFPAVLAGMAGRTALADDMPLDDDGIVAHRFKSRAARNLAFLYAVDRTLVDGEVVPFASPAEREAVGDRVRDLLLNLFPVSRILVDPPIGGWDRDISTSEELLSYATAYDTLAGAGYPFEPGDEAEIVRRLQLLAGSLYETYVDGHAFLHQNNHRSKGGASLVVAGVALAEVTSDPATDPDGYLDPANWIDRGLQEVDKIMRWALVAGDGAYGEGPFYLRYASQNLLPFARAWDRLLDGAAYDAGGVLVPSFWRHPPFLRGQRWQLDMTLPDGSLVPQDDGNVGRSHYFGAAPRGEDDGAYAWRWANAPAPFEGDGNVDLGPDSIVVTDPDVPLAPPVGSPTAFYPEGGNAIFRSDWGADGIVAVVMGESGVASEFGRDRDGAPVTPESHEHNDPGSFLLHAYGERLAMDPGYVRFSRRYRFSRPHHHNMILVDGSGPVDFLGASLAWPDAPDDPPPADGEASLDRTLDSSSLDAARVVSRYGTGSFEDPYSTAPLVERRFLFADDAYLAIADRVVARSGTHDYTWLIQGNGGGTSEGTYEPLPQGGRWSRAAARLDVGYAFDSGAPSFSTRESLHEIPGKEERSHTTLETTVSGGAVHGVQLVYPTPIDRNPPTLEVLTVAGAAALRLDDEDGDRRVLLIAREGAGSELSLGAAQTGATPLETDARLALFDLHQDGSLRLAWAEETRSLAFGGEEIVRGRRGSRLGIARGEAEVEVVAEGKGRKVTVSGLPFTPLAADGACALKTRGDRTKVKLARSERRVVLRADGGNSVPAADPGRPKTAKVGREIRLDGRKSCDLDGDALTPHWELVSAPPGSAWQLTETDGWRPQLLLDRPGPYRVELVVTDANGAASRPVRVLLHGGDRCQGGLDEDGDGMIDRADPDCDERPS